MIAAIITGPIVQGFIPNSLRDKNPGLVFPSTAASKRVVLPVDAIMLETFTKTADPTSSPVEDGSMVTDHVIQRPDKLSLDCIVTDTPVTLFGLRTKAQSNALSPVLNAITFLNDLVESRQLFDFVGSMQVYKGMVMTSWSPTKNAQLGSSIRFTCQMQKMRIVNSAAVSSANIKQPTNASKGSKGRQTAAPATPSQAAQVESFRDPNTGYIMGGG